MKDLRKNNKGFTLIELIATSMIIFIMSGVAIVGFSSYFSSGRARMLESVGNQINLARAYSQTQAYPTYIEFRKDESRKQNIAKIYVVISEGNEKTLSEESVGNAQYTIQYMPADQTAYSKMVDGESTLTLGFNKANCSFKSSDGSCEYAKSIIVDTEDRVLYLVKETGRTYIE